MSASSFPVICVASSPSSTTRRWDSAPGSDSSIAASSLADDICGPELVDLVVGEPEQLAVDVARPLADERGAGLHRVRALRELGAHALVPARADLGVGELDVGAP